MKNRKPHILPKSVGETEATLKLLHDGLTAHMADHAKWKVAGKTVSKLDLAQRVQGYFELYRAVREAEAAFHKLTAQRDAVGPEVATFLADMLVTLQYELGRQSDDLEAFGFRARKDASELTVEEKAARVAKIRASRQKKSPGGPAAESGHAA